ncbi:hypothetical protein BGZ83_005339 [Gryganskiella cystojenkinii]|nr:hypothetical protein BGZ83_005339 [Gryganskiella cystojenkinii]
MIPTRTLLSVTAIGMALSVMQSAAALTKEDVCSTPECKEIASGILHDMNPDIDPCQDFSEFVCGGFNNKTKIAPDLPSNDHFSILYEQNQRIFLAILDRNNPKSPKAHPGDVYAKRNIEKFQGLYSSCMDLDRLSQAGRKPLTDEIQEILKLFPVSNSDLITNTGASTDTSTNNTTTLNKTTLSSSLAHYNKIGIDSFVLFSAQVDFKDPTKYSLMLMEGGLGLPAKEYYQDPTIASMYQSVVQQMFEVVFDEQQKDGPSSADNTTTSKWSEVAKNVVAFEIQLSNIGTNLTDMYNPTGIYNPMTIDQLGSMTPSIDWNLVFDKTLPSDVHSLAQIIVTSPSYQEKLETLLQQSESKSIQNYFVWKLILKRAASLSTEFSKPLRVLSGAMTGVSSNATTERWKECVQTVDTNLGDLSGHYFVEETFKDTTLEQMSEMIESIRSTYREDFPKLDWLDNTTREGALQKLNAIQGRIGYSTEDPDIKSSQSLDEHYKDVKIDDKDYYGNLVRALTWTAQKGLSNLGKPVNKKSVLFVPQTVNAYYSAFQNQIFFPAGILRPPFFQPENPEYLNYGAIGMIAAHEITHGFDNRGHLFDADGKLVDWWTNATTAAFNNKSQCFVKQYSSYTVNGPDGKDYNVNGALTLAENIADNGGLKQAFNSWQARSLSKANNNQKLPGLEKYTPEQLFFMSFGRMWCAKMRPELFLGTVLTDTHSPPQWRINGAAQNTAQFATAFQCNADSPMNPTKKCDLW